MKMKVFLSLSHLILAILLLQFTGCIPCGYGNNRKPCSDEFNFRLVDRNTGIRIDSIYRGLFIYADHSGGDPAFEVRKASDFFIGIPGYPKDTLYLGLSDTDRDTLVFNIKHDQTKCCSDYSIIQGITYNGLNAEYLNGAFLFKK